MTPASPPRYYTRTMTASPPKVSYDKGKVAQLLAQGISLTAIAGALGKTPEWLQQELDSNPTLQDAVARATMATSTQAIDDTLQVKQASSMLIHRLQELAQTETSIVSAMKALTQMQDFLAEQDTTSTKPKQSAVDLNINLLLQQSLSIDLDSKNAIISINGRDLTTLPAEQVEVLKNDYLEDQTLNSNSSNPTD